jgi:hypothetical protein
MLLHVTAAPFCIGHGAALLHVAGTHTLNDDCAYVLQVAPFLQLLAAGSHAS